jgi:hypothetical protein
MRTSTSWLLTVLLSIFAFSPRTAVAQVKQNEVPRLTIAAAGGVATPFDADFDFTATSWEISVRGQTAPHLAVEGFVEQWQHVTGDVLLNRDIQGPNGFLGRVGRIEQSTRYRMRTTGVNALVTGRSGRVTFGGGGGIGFLEYDRRFTQATTGCDASIAQLCNQAANTFSSSSFTVQGVAEVDVAIVRRIQGFGRYLLVVPTRDPGFGHGTVVAGVRVTLW